MLSGFSGGGDGMSVLRWMIPPVFLFYLGCELILIYTRKFYRPSVPSRRCRYAAYSAQSRSECISQQVSQISNTTIARFPLEMLVLAVSDTWLDPHWLVARIPSATALPLATVVFSLSARRVESAKPSHLMPPVDRIALPLTEQRTHSQCYCCRPTFSTRRSLKLQPRCMSQPLCISSSALAPDRPIIKSSSHDIKRPSHQGGCLALLKPL